jgi:protein SCO1/2
LNTRGLQGAAGVVLAVALAWPVDAPCHESRKNERLAKIGPAPEFTLTNQDGKRIALKDLRGKVLAITFIFASCADTCPLLTATMAGLQDRLGAAFGPDIQFVSITVDPSAIPPRR